MTATFQINRCKKIETSVRKFSADNQIDAFEVMTIYVTNGYGEISEIKLFMDDQPEPIGKLSLAPATVDVLA